VFETRQHLMSALEAMQEISAPNSHSLITVGGSRRGSLGDPFRPGFLAALEVRTELVRLLRLLDERSRRLLLLWFVQGRPVVEIANELGISRVHCYRLRNKALAELLEAASEPADVTPRAS